MSTSLTFATVAGNSACHGTSLTWICLCQPVLSARLVGMAALRLTGALEAQTDMANAITMI